MTDSLVPFERRLRTGEEITAHIERTLDDLMVHIIGTIETLHTTLPPSCPGLSTERMFDYVVAALNARVARDCALAVDLLRHRREAHEMQLSLPFEQA